MFLRKDVKLELLRKVPLFSRCSKHSLEDIASIADELDLPDGRELTREGERGREFFVLVEGEVDVTKGGDHIRTLSAGDFFGEIALVSDEPRTATVTAKGPIRVLVITDRAFKALIERSPGIDAEVQEAAAERTAADDL
jgi:CRP-like cAMP-binding protein